MPFQCSVLGLPNKSHHSSIHDSVILTAYSMLIISTTYYCRKTFPVVRGCVERVALGPSQRSFLPAFLPPSRAPSPKSILWFGYGNNLDTMLPMWWLQGTVTRMCMSPWPAKFFCGSCHCFSVPWSSSLKRHRKDRQSCSSPSLAGSWDRERQNSNGPLPLTQKKHMVILGQYSWQQEEREGGDKKREKKKETGIKKTKCDWLQSQAALWAQSRLPLPRSTQGLLLLISK